MPLCINQSGTWRNISTQCVNQSGTWRKVLTGCINQSGTWRSFGFTPPPTVSISVSPTSVVRSGAEGATSTLSWSSTNATSVTSTTNFTTSSVSGSQTVGPSATTTYSITVSNAAGSASGSATLTVTAPTLGSNFGGGILICRTASVNWIISPSSASVIRTWYLRGDSNTIAQQVSGCTGWFVPSSSQLLNPGYSCSIYWSPDNLVCGGRYWSNTEYNANYAYYVRMSNGREDYWRKTCPYLVRSFRCVTF